MNMQHEAHPDLQHERMKASFDPDRLTYFLDGGKDRTERRRQIEQIVATDPTGIFDNSQNNYLDRKERHVRALAKAVRMVEIGRMIQALPTDDSKENILASQDFGTLIASVADDMPLALHWVMFVPNIKSLCDDQQQSEWLPKCLDWQVIGCYAQTELGHGSNIRALETTATFQTEAQSGIKGGAFVINSPTLTSTKFWPGTLGRTANHAMVIARLIDGKCIDRGIHNFLVPLRSMTDHMPLKGIKTGDIGPKIGYNNMDNGFAQFDNVVIPRRHMAMRFAIVDEDGNYKANKVTEAASRISYITMMQVRAHIINEAGKILAMACTINVRYSAVRRQGYDEGRGGAKTGAELQILDYTQQQHRIFPLLAASYCFFFTGLKVMQDLQVTETKLVAGDPSVTKEFVSDMHASTSCLKSFCSTVACDGIEECRKACGGHGFLMASGLPEMLGTYLQNPTVEGDNHMLPQQTVRVLLKIVHAIGARDSKKIQSYRDCESRYLVDALQNCMSGKASSACGATCTKDFFDLDLLLGAFEHRTACLLLDVAQKLQASPDKQKAWNNNLILMARVSRAHALTLILRNTSASLKEEERKSTCFGPNELDVMRDLAILFALYWMEKEMGDFLEVGHLNSSQAEMVRTAVLDSLAKVRPNAVPLVDARDFSDFRLKSALGRYDGQVYPAIMESSFREGLNATEPGPGYEHLRKLIVDGVGVSPTSSRL